MVSVLVTLIIIGVALGLILKYVPMAPPFPTVITVIVVLACCLWLLNVFGIYSFPAPRGLR
jgi:hypothetical protein